MNNKKVKVLMIIGSLGDGGKERQLLLLLKTFKQNENIITTLISMNAGGERENEARQFADYFEVLPGKRGLIFLTPLGKLMKLIKQQDINLIHTWGSGIWDFLGVIAGRLSRIPVIHNGIRSAPKHLNIFNRITRVGALMADVTVANSYAGLQSFGLERRSQSRVVHNGLDTTRFDGIQKVEDGYNICMVANFREAKDHKTMILAFAEILGYFPCARLHLVGHDYGTLSGCFELARELNITNNIEFIENCSHPEPIIGKCQIGVLSTNESVHGEGISNALLEYMALSKPVIASINGGNAEVVTHDNTGYLVKPNDPSAISKKINYLFSNPQIAKAMGAQAKKYVEENFSVVRMEKGYTHLYQELIRKI